MNRRRFQLGGPVSGLGPKRAQRYDPACSGYTVAMPLSRALPESVVVITGGSSGIGMATAHELAQRGAAVVIGARGTDALDTVADDCRRLGGRAIAVPTDVSDPAAVHALAERAVSAYGHIDAWVNNASVSTYGFTEQVPAEEFRRVVEV